MNRFLDDYGLCHEWVKIELLHKIFETFLTNIFDKKPTHSAPIGALFCPLNMILSDALKEKTTRK